MNIIRSSNWKVPAHITGIFQIVRHDDPLKMGSRGAGFSIDEPVITNVIIKDSKKERISVFFNNKKIDGKVSLTVAKNFDDNLANKDLQIQHHSKLPMQAGFGSSGAGAIGTAFALNDALKMNYTNQELGQIAHKAEVHCSTGLGDVIAQMHAGAEIRLEPGGPGIGKIQSMIWPDDIKIVTIALGTISTKKVITNPKHILEINKTSEKLLSELLENPSLDSFIEISYTFAVQAHLMTPQVKDLVETLRANNFPSSMIMLGQSVFTILTSNKAKDCASFLKKIYPNANIMISTLATQGPIKIDNQ